MGSRGRYVLIPYEGQSITVSFPFKGGQMKMQVDGKTYDSVDQVIGYLTGPNFIKSAFMSQSGHEGSLKTASKERKQQAKVNKAAQAEKALKDAKIQKIMDTPAVKDAISKFGLHNKRQYKVIFGNIPAKKMYDTVDGIINTLTDDELRQMRKIEVDTPKFY
jgi:phosphotransferase system IIB component